MAGLFSVQTATNGRGNSKCSPLTKKDIKSLPFNHSWTCPSCSPVPPQSPPAPPRTTVMYTSTVTDTAHAVTPAPGIPPPTTVNTTRVQLPSHPKLISSYPPTASKVDQLPSPSGTQSPPPPVTLTHSPSSSVHTPTPKKTHNMLTVLQWNAGGLRPKLSELSHFLDTTQPDLVCIQETNLNSQSKCALKGYIPIRSDRTHSRSGILAPDDPHPGGGVITFVREGLSFTVLPTSSISALDPYSDYVGVNVFLKDSSPISFLNVYAPPIRSSPTDTRPNTFSPSILPAYTNLFILGDFNCHHPFWDAKGTPDRRGEEMYDWILSSDLLPLNDPDSPTLLHRSSGSRSSPDVTLVPSSLALSCSWEVQKDLGSDHVPILTSIPLAPLSSSNERAPAFNFEKARWQDFSEYFDSHCPAVEEYSTLTLASAAAIFSNLTLSAAKSAIPFGRLKRPPKAWWSSEVECAVSERRKAFAVAHKGEEERQAYISASRHASSVISQAKAATWREKCSSLTPKSDPRSVYSLLRSIAGSASPASSLPNFPNCPTPKKSATLYANYLREHFSASQPKPLRSRGKGYLNELRSKYRNSELQTEFSAPLTISELHSATADLSSSTATGPDNIAYPMLKHLPQAGMEFLLYIFNLSWTLHSFPNCWKTSSIIPIHKPGKPRDNPSSFRPISLTSCVSKLFERIILSRVLFFLESNGIFSPHQAGFRPGRSTLDQVLYLSQSISDGFHKPRPGARTVLATIDFSKAFDSVWHPALYHKLIASGLPPHFR